MNYRTEVIGAGRFLAVGWMGRFVILMAVLLSLAAFVYPEVLSKLLSSVLHRRGSSHGLLVPFISGYLIWLKRERIMESELNFQLLPGGALVVAGFALKYLLGKNTGFILPSISFLIVVCGLIIAVFGIRLFKIIGFPILFLGTIIPLPRPLYMSIAEMIRAVTTAGSIWVMQLVQIPIHQEGFSIYLPNTNLFVAISCSGIRYLLSYFVLSLPYAYFMKKSTRVRIALVFASIPLAIFAGVLRLSSIYIAAYYIGPSMAGRPHVAISWLVFLAVLLLAICLDQYLTGIWSKRSGAVRST